MKFNKKSKLAIMMCVAWRVVCTCHAAAAPDAGLLVRGIESARMQIPPSRLHLHMVFKDAIRINASDETVEFDGARRRYEDNSKVRVPRGYFNGAEVALFDGKDVTLRDLRRDTADCMFDPRLLGLTTSYTWPETLGAKLPYRTASSITLIGEEKLDGVSTWHIQINNKKPVAYQVDVWASGEDFKVYKYKYSFSAGYSIATSYYQNTNYPWLPTRVESASFTTNGVERFHHTVTLLGAEANISLPESTWTIAGLDVPIGTWISDTRIMRREYQWDGHKLKRASHLDPDPQSALRNPKIRIAIILLIALSAGVPLFFLLKQKN